ncbi:unnamed protein product [Calypogeia fissa]
MSSHSCCGLSYGKGQRSLHISIGRRAHVIDFAYLSGSVFFGRSFCPPTRTEADRSRSTIQHMIMLSKEIALVIREAKSTYVDGTGIIEWSVRLELSARRFVPSGNVGTK